MQNAYRIEGFRQEFREERFGGQLQPPDPSKQYLGGNCPECGGTPVWRGREVFCTKCGLSLGIDATNARPEPQEPLPESTEILIPEPESIIFEDRCEYEVGGARCTNKLEGERRKPTKVPWLDPPGRLLCQSHIIEVQQEKDRRAAAERYLNKTRGKYNLLPDSYHKKRSRK